MVKKGNIPWNLGLTKETNKSMMKISKKMKKRMKGNIPWNKGLKGVMKAWNKGIPMTKSRKNKLKLSLKKFWSSKKGLKIRKSTGRKNKKKLKLFYKTNEGKIIALQRGEQSKKKLKKYYKTKKGLLSKQIQQQKLKQYFNSTEGKKELKKRILKGRGFIKNFNKRYKVKYKNKIYKLRSKMEVAVVKYFIKNKIKFYYEGEKNIFFLKKIKRYYINDFYLPEKNIYIQVKGYFYKDKEPLKKFNIWKEENPKLNIKLWDFNYLLKNNIVKKMRGKIIYE